MKIQIKSLAGSILFEGDFSAVKDALLAALKNDADLRGAYLGGANLGGAYLRGANLRGAYLRKEIKIKAIQRPFFQVGPIGQDDRILMAFSTEKGIYLKTGCFFGTVDEFLKNLQEKHGNNDHAHEYKSALVLIAKHFEIWDK